jgi:hypothetical protein
MGLTGAEAGEPTPHPADGHQTSGRGIRVQISFTRVRATALCPAAIVLFPAARRVVWRARSRRSGEPDHFPVYANRRCNQVRVLRRPRGAVARVARRRDRRDRQCREHRRADLRQRARPQLGGLLLRARRRAGRRAVPGPARVRPHRARPWRVRHGGGAADDRRRRRPCLPRPHRLRRGVAIGDRRAAGAR